MIIRKQPFILIEVFIAIALLTLCAFPLIGSSFKSYRYQKEHLLKLELERQAELYFYQVLKETVGTLNYDAIPSKKVSWTPFKKLELSLGDIKNTYYPHYHLYYSTKSKSKTHKKVLCRICFPTTKEDCPSFPEKKEEPQKPLYKFAFLVKKVAENSLDPHGKNIEKNLKDHERSPSNIQTLHSSK